MKIAWEKWIPSNKKIINDGWEDEEVSEYEKIERAEKPNILSSIVSLDGPHPFQSAEPIYSEKDFNLWIGHCDFTLTPNILMDISNYPGVETVDPISRYRMRIGIGKLFHANEVMSGLAKHLIEKQS